MNFASIVSALSRVVRNAIAVFAASTTLAFAATDYSDTWWAAAGSEGGWGVNFTQTGDFIFATFFIYGLDGKAAWLTAEMNREGSSDAFNGPLYRTTGTWFGAPTWTGYQYAQVGTARFVATSAQAGTLTYTADGVTVTKSVERQPLTVVNASGVYLGAASGRRSGCQVSGPILDSLQFEIIHDVPSGLVRIDQFSLGGELICRIEGRASPFGKLLLVDNADYSCTDWQSKIRVYNLRRTTTGFEAQWFADGGGGCTETGNLSGVTQSP